MSDFDEVKALDSWRPSAVEAPPTTALKPVAVAAAARSSSRRRADASGAGDDSFSARNPGGLSGSASVPSLGAPPMPALDVGRMAFRGGRANRRPGASGIPSSSTRLYGDPTARSHRSFANTGRASLAGNGTARSGLGHSQSASVLGRQAMATGRSRYKPGMSVRDDNADGVSVASRYTSRSRMSGMSGMSGMSRSRGPTMGGTTSRTARSSQLARTGRTMARGRRQFPARDHDEDVVLQEVKLPDEMPEAQKQLLRVQHHVIGRVQAKASDKNHESAILVRAFRQCKPDEFGLISRGKFRKGMKSQFRLSNRQADILFNSVDNKGEEEIKYSAFRKAFESVEEKHVEPPLTRRHKHAVPNAPGHARQQTIFQSRQVSLADLPKSEKQRYRDFMALRKVIQEDKHALKKAFNTRLESQGNVRTLTQLPYDSVAQVLAQRGVQLSEDRLQQLVPAVAASAVTGLPSFDPSSDRPDRITFSQLHRATHNYFADLEGVGPSHMTDRARNMEFRGRFVGCRKVGVGPASKVHTSAKDFLAHHDLPHESPRRKLHHRPPRHDSALPPVGGAATHNGGNTSSARGGPFAGVASSQSQSQSQWQSQQGMPAGKVSSRMGGSVALEPSWNHASHDGAWKQRWTDKTVPQPRPSAKKMLSVGTNDGHGDVISWRPGGMTTQRSAMNQASHRSRAGGSTARSEAPFATGRNWG